jgi:hypothetical protein
VRRVQVFVNFVLCVLLRYTVVQMAEPPTERPLEHAGVLKQVLSYAGPGEWIYLAPMQAVARVL